MTNKKTDTKDKFFVFCETWIISIIIAIFLSITIINYIIGYSDVYQFFVEKTLGKSLDNLKGSLLSIAAIFIGIYVTVFTLLGSIKVDSIFAYLNEDTFKKLINYIRNAFIASFTYLILVMILEISYDTYADINFWFVLLNAAIVIYMFLTALRFGIILYLSFSKDLGNLQNNIKLHRNEKRRVEQLQFRLEKYLDEFEKEQKTRHNIKMSKIINENQDNDIR